jgi:hypothetical protein
VTLSTTLLGCRRLLLIRYNMMPVQWDGQYGTTRMYEKIKKGTLFLKWRK